MTDDGPPSAEEPPLAEPTSPAEEPPSDAAGPPLAEPTSAAGPPLAEPTSAAGPPAEHSLPPEQARPPIPLATIRGLLPASFDLVGRASEDMRRASFYIGAVTLGTLGPLVLAVWALVVADRVFFDAETLFAGDEGGSLGLLGSVGLVGLVVAAVESRTLATAVLGARMASRSLTVRQALTRARARFWPSVGASILVGIVVGVAQAIGEALVTPVLGQATEATLITSTIITAIVGAPFAYVLSGIVLGDVGAGEAIRRSFMVARARRGAAAIIVTFETISALLILFGLSAGADTVARFFGVLGIGPDSGPAGLAIATLALVAGVFALGTLLYTVTALTVAPQVVMFLGLTHATVGLDQAEQSRPGRWFTRPMLAGFVLALVGLASVVLPLL